MHKILDNLIRMMHSKEMESNHCKPIIRHSLLLCYLGFAVSPLHCSTPLLHHSLTLILLADAVLAFMWATSQAFRMCPVERRVFIENLEHYAKESDYPRLDVFICTADPYKEPPMCSKLTLFAFMEAARFATHWLPYCKKNKIVERCPDAYFKSNNSWFPETDRIKMMYENMRVRVENVVQEGTISRDYMTDEGESEAFSRWTDEFTPQNHPPVVQVLLGHSKDKDVTGHTMPNLVYVSRGKSMNLPHNFKAGALNVLIRVSATMTNAPVVLTLDSDIHVFEVHMPGMDGLAGPIHVGSGGFFRRRVFYGCPSETLEMNRDRQVSHSIKSREVLAMAHHVAGCKYENQTEWGRKMGFRYGSLVEDVYTSCLMQCEGWKSIYCNPKGLPAFLGNSPTNFHDFLNQTRRWSIGLLEVAFCKYSPITYGTRTINLLSGLCFAYYSFWPIWSIPITIYAFLPQLALLNYVSIFPKMSDPWFFVYIFCFLGAYGQDYLELILSGDNSKVVEQSESMDDEGLSSFSIGSVEYILKSIGISTFGFNVTSKAVEEEQSKRYKKGMFEFGVASPLFLPLTTAAIINLVSFLWGIAQIFRQGRIEDLLLQILLVGFAMVNSDVRQHEMLEWRLWLRVGELSIANRNWKLSDVTGRTMPNLVYVSRGKSIKLPHNYKAGALDVLLCVSATMTNATVILTLDSDMYSNDPQTPLRALQACISNSSRWNGWTETSELNQDHLVNKSIESREVLSSAHHVAGFNFESQTQWGTKMGFRYGSLVEDMYTSYMLQSYGQDYVEVILSGGTTQRWWNDQRVWLMRDSRSIGISTFRFNVTSKAVEREQSKPAIINLVSFLLGMAQVFRQGSLEALLLQMLLIGFAMVNCWPIYEAMVLRADIGINKKITTVKHTEYQSTPKWKRQERKAFLFTQGAHAPDLGEPSLCMCILVCHLSSAISPSHCCAALHLHGPPLHSSS
ncbi:hypothetical protein AAG906_034042 [Vitis piasezkii]